MDKNKRTFINVLAQYVRTTINICLSLYSTKLVLQALGKSDYGLFMVVGGVVTMLGFLTNAMVVTTQRHLSFYYGKNDLKRVSSVFSNALISHIGLGLLMIAVFMAILPFLISEQDGYLNISPDRVGVAKYVYIIAVATLFVTFITAPFKGLFIAKENIVFNSIVDVCDGVLKVGLVLLLIITDTDNKLLLYALILFVVMLLNLIVYSITAKLKYKECSILPRFSDVSWNEIKNIFSFAGWTIYSTGCIIFRTQGIAVLLNRAFGTIINSAYGIATQVSNSTAFLSQAILNAMSPRVIKAEGAGNRQEMLRLAGITSKFCFLLLSMFAIPLCFEMKDILNFWLGEDKVPEYAVLFCQCVVIAAVCDQLTIGLGTANQALGKIRNYSLLVNTTKVLTLPLVWLALHEGCHVAVVMYIFIAVECICVLLRLIYMKKVTNLSVTAYSKQVFLRVVGPTVALIIVCILCCMMPDVWFRFFITLAVAVLIDVVVVFTCALEASERKIVLNFIRRKQS